MRFMMFVVTDDEPDDDRTDDIAGWTASAHSSGRRLQGSALAPPEETATVKVRGGLLSVSDGPQGDTTSSIVGFDILDCTDLQDAIDVARTHPMARIGRIELRRFVDLDLDDPTR